MLAQKTDVHGWKTLCKSSPSGYAVTSRKVFFYGDFAGDMIDDVIRRQAEYMKADDWRMSSYHLEYTAKGIDCLMLFERPIHD